MTTITVPADEPPSPETWHAYPDFSSAHSCWTRPGNGVIRAAPSLEAKRRRGTAPAEIARRLLARLGDRRYIERITIGKPPAATLKHLHAGYAGRRPPLDALWAYISAPASDTPPAHPTPTPEQIRDTMIASWETESVFGALRDDFCEAGGRPLVGASTNGDVSTVSDSTFALLQDFPNPPARAFRRRVDTIGRRYGFRVVSLRLLQPRQLAPLLVVETSRDREAFVHDVPAIAQLLDPRNNGNRQGAVTFESFFLEARDGKGPFVRIDNVNRGEAAGGEWSWNRCVYPSEHSEPLGAKPCP